MNDIFLNRRNNLLTKLKENNSEAIVITKYSDVYYFSGFDSNENVATIVITNNNNYFIVDGRFINQFKKEVKNFQLIQTDNKECSFLKVKEILNDEKISSFMFSYDEVSYKDILELKDLINNNTKDSTQIIEKLRAIKDNKEIENIKKAINISEESFFELLRYVKPGQTELEIKNFLESEIFKRGCRELAFPTIIAAGEINGSLPHAIPSNYVIKDGDLITIDFGAKYNNYCADITRTIGIGNIDKKKKDLYNLVLNIKNECANQLSINTKICDINNIFIENLKINNYEVCHSIGHGFGIDVHEYPSLNSQNIDKFSVNNVHTIEPGIYEYGFCGIRIEDDYLIKEDSVECLSTKIPTELIII